MILVAGGDTDPNILCLLDDLRSRRVRHHALLVGANSHPAVRWDLGNDRLIVNGKVLKPTAAFIRSDVFTNLSDERPESAYRAYAWFGTIMGWIAAHPRIRSFNQRISGNLYKPQVLQMAFEAGLEIPHTLVTNDLAYLEQQNCELVIKPVNGGDYCQPLKPLLQSTPRKSGRAASPAIVQNRLVQPEVRVYRIGSRFLSYSIISDQLDYRMSNATRVEPLAKVPPGLVGGLRTLTNQLGLTFSAADFKTCPKTGRFLFLEVNSGPMFAAFNQADGGRLNAATISYLTGGRL